MKLTELLDQIQRLDQEATKGPWEAVGNSIESDGTYEDIVTTEVDCTTYCYGGRGGGVLNGTDAELIAQARTLMPQLAQALQEVLKIHPRKWALDDVLDYCPTCYKTEGATYPCDTVRAVVAVMGAGHGSE